MNDEEIAALIERTIRATVAEYKRAGLLTQSQSAIYADVSAILEEYYENGQKSTEITYAINGLRFDPYFRIIGMYYEERKTLEEIAAAFDVDVSTIVRNKKRLCLAIYNDLV